MTTTLPAWVYRLINRLVEAHDEAALEHVPHKEQLAAAKRKRGGK